jgi:hypothetical protein
MMQIRWNIKWQSAKIMYAFYMHHVSTLLLELYKNQVYIEGI